MTSIFLLGIAAFAAGAVLAWWWEHSRRQTQIALLEKDKRTYLDKSVEALEELQRAREQLALANEQLGAKDSQIARLEERAVAVQNAFEQMRSSLPDTFKTLASEVLEEKSKTFAQQNQASLGTLLEPLKSRLEEFQKKVETAHTDQVRDSASLRQQIETMVASTTKVSEEANNLATALKGSGKAQGNWGELVLETILESAGLRQGQEYEVQETYAAENGRRAQPDVVIHLPGSRHLVIDSKVSLVHYETYCNATDEAARASALNGHLASIHTHVRGLGEKKYQELYDLNSLDFVIMFVPIEPAFILALSNDGKLWEQAWQRNVLLVSPGTLLFVVRTVAYLWRQERQKQNVEEIARRGAELYTKLAGFVSDLEEVGSRLEQAQRSYEAARLKLSTGKGNVIRQAEMLKALGIKPTKQLPQGMVELAQQEDLELSTPQEP